MSSKVLTKKLEVGKLRVGQTIEFSKIYATVKEVKMVNLSRPTISDTVYVLELVGDSGPFKGKKSRLYLAKNDKLDMVLKRWGPLRYIVPMLIWIRDHLTKPVTP